MNKLSYKISLLMVLYSSATVAIAGDVFKGQELYTQYCQACHGMDGRGMMPGTRDFTRGDGLLRNDTKVHESIRTGKNGMPSFRGILTDREILDIISHLRTFQR